MPNAALLVPMVMYLAPLVQEPPLEEAPGREEAPAEASIGKGGRDLVARLRLQSDANMRPTVTFAMDGDAGEDPSIIGPTTTMLGAQPMVTASITPRPHFELFAGMGIGAAQLVDGACTEAAPTACDGPTHTATAATYGTELGARIEWQGPPLVVSMGVDGVESRGWYAGTGLALELNP